MKLQAPAHGWWICLALIVAGSPGASRLEAQPIPLPDHSVRSPLAAAAAAAAAARESAAARDAASSSLQSARLASAGNVIPPVPALPDALVVPVESGLGAGPAEEPAKPDRPDLRVGPPDTLPGVAEVAPPAAFPAVHGRPSPLVPLYVSFAALQIADVASTHRALEAGGREANPVVKGFAGNEAAMVAVKAGATAGTIFLTERLWKKNRPAAVILMLGLNGAYAAIVAHNYRR